ncbi:zinc finger protein 318 [Labrus mixtus]|uniref:zinc finger protein 318 n=1 Tax=Labrus mixtus TaxID=508554 RepID=UPI0029C01A6D|nr:zinc finger protein 318 [Labrus mixtus]
MYRGRPPPRGGYRPPPSRPYPAPGYRDDRGRPRAPYHPGYPDHGHQESYRRSPPRRRYPSPPSGSHPSGEYWAGGPPRDRSPSPRGPVPLDHNLLITVGNELTGPSGSAPPRHHERDYPLRPAYERSRSRGRSRPGSRERSPDRSRAKSRGRSKSRARSKSRPRSHSRSPDRSRAKSRGRSKSRSPDRSRAKSRGRSKSRPRSRSRTRSRSRSRGRSPGRGYSKAASRGRSKSRQRSRSVSSSSSSSSNDDSDKKSRIEFKELETARRRKELEEMLGQPTKSILKKRNDSEDSPSLRSLDSPRGESSSLSRVAEQLLQAVKGMEPHMVATMLSELRSDPHMAHRAGLDAEIKEILNLLGGQAEGGNAPEKNEDDIDDEEKFLYGDAEEQKPPPSSEPLRHHGLDLYGDVTEDALYGDYPPQMAVSSQMYGLPQGASPHLSVPPTMGEADMRYASRPTISPEQNIKIQVSNPAYPPGTEPLEEGERQAVEEYEKIQDLLKTIGLDLGVTEISKMAARTKERLHGNKPPPKTPTRRRYSSDSSDDSRQSRGRRRRSHSGSSSSSSSRSHSRGRGASWSSNNSNRKSSAPPKSHKDKDRDVKEMKAGRSEAALPQPPPKLPPQQLTQTTDPNTVPSHPGVPIPTYPPSQVHSMIPPNYPPPGYGQYGNYHPYMHQQWPPMYPPPMTVPPQTGPEEFPPTLPYNQQYNKPTPEPGAKGLGKSSVQDVAKGSCKVSSHDRTVSEEQNNESQKQKVLEEREKLKQERETRMKKKEYLMKELERLRKQQGELLRKKRREKDGHKDPLLQEISRLQEEVMTQISNLRKEHETAEKKRSEIDKVALILGLNPSDRPRKTGKQPEEPEEPENQPPKLPPPEKKKRLADKSPERRQTANSSTIKTSVEPPLAPRRPSLDKTPVSAPPPTPPPDPFDYYDAGNHWCKNCNVTSGSMFDFFTHLHNKTHRKTLDPYDRPWAPTPTKIAKNTSSVEKLTKPAKGSEFLLPVRGFFCLLCKEFYGDAICAEEHVTTHTHNENYKKQMYENPLYEQRRNLDRQAGLTLETSGKKRKHEDSEKGNNDKEEKSKHKKEKKEKDRKKETDDTLQKEEKLKVKKEEQEGKTKPGKKEQDFKDPKSSDGERPIYNKKDESEKYKFIKKDDKYRYNREEEEADKYSKREEDRYKYGREEEFRYRYRKDEDDKYDHPKYGPRNDESRYKYGKSSDFRSKNDREEGKPKVEREAFRKLEPEKPAAKPEVSKAEPPTKPYDLPKVFCGPSPAMRAKLRKQSLEAGKPATPTPTTSFGRFTWKKKENVLAKEAQKAAAEFVKDDEDASMQEPASVEDSFAKSMAVAKEIAQKLSGHQTVPSPWVSNTGNRGRIRPNLPAPAAVMRKAAMTGKPAPLNTFLSIRPQNTSLQGPSPKDLPTLNELANTVSLPYIPMHATSKAEPQVVGVKAISQASGPESFKPKTDPPVFGPVPFQANPAPPVSKSAMPEVKPPQPISKPPPFEVQPAPPVSKPSQIDAKLVPSDYKPLPFQATTASSSVTTSAPSVFKPSQPTMIKIVSDVAAPGVPESEQTRTVFVKPPPFMKISEGAQKSEKLKSTLAAAKAKDLFDIFYSSVGKSNSSTVTKTATDTKADRRSTNKSELSTLQVLKTQPQHQLVSLSQPPAVVCTAPQPDSNKSSPQTQPEMYKNPPGPLIQTETKKNPPGPQIQPETDKNPPGPKFQTETDKNPPGPKIQQITEKTPPSPPVQPETDKNPPGLRTQPESDIQIASVWSLQPTLAPKPDGGPCETTSQSNQPILNRTSLSEAQNAPQNQSLISRPASQITARTDAELEQASPIQTDPQSDPLTNQDTLPQACPETHLDTVPVPEPKAGRKTRGKITPTKKTAAARPVRQTRSQTRYQTRHQQQSQSEPEHELASGDSDSAASDSKGLDTSDSGPGLQPGEAAAGEGEPPMVEMTPETLGLPSDMTSLDFEYDFNFE